MTKSVNIVRKDLCETLENMKVKMQNEQNMITSESVKGLEMQIHEDMKSKENETFDTMEKRIFSVRKMQADLDKIVLGTTVSYSDVIDSLIASQGKQTEVLISTEGRFEGSKALAGKTILYRVK